MSVGSGIEWTDATWNPVVGCTRASAGCDNCYAVTMTHRLEKMGKAKYAGLTVLNGRGERHFNGTVRTVPEALETPLRWKKSRRVFVNSMSDLFHRDVPAEFIARVFAIMGLASWHRFQVLTKRPERMAELLTSPAFAEMVVEADSEFGDFADAVAERFGYYDPCHRLSTDWRAQDHCRLPLPNVWLGTSCEDQAAADARIPHLLRCPAAVRFLSCEPLLGPIDLSDSDGEWGMGGKFSWLELGIHWVIVGGESGPGARACNVEWVRSIVGQCKSAGVACFVKQLGSRPIAQEGVDYRRALTIDGPDAADGYAGEDERTIEGTKATVTLRVPRLHIDADSGLIGLPDRKGGKPDQWPEDLRVREFPKGVG